MGLLVIGWLFGAISHAQPVPTASSLVRLTGTIVDDQRQPLSDALVTFSTLDSIPRLLQSAFTAVGGGFKLGVLTRQPVLVTLSRVGYQQQMDTLPPIDSLFVRTYTLRSAERTLNEVQVRAAKQPFELRADRIVINVAANPLLSGGSVADILSVTPRVAVKGATIEVNQMNIVGVYQDGRQVLLEPGSAAVLKYLNGLPANSVQTVEVVTAPSAKYDAAGGGIVLIRTQPSSSRGFSGNVAATVGSGSYLRSNGSLSLTWRTDKWSVNALSTLNYQKRLFTYFGEQRLAALSQTARDGFTNSDTRQLDEAITRNIRLTTLYTPTPRTSISGVLFLNPSQSERQGLARLDYRLPVPGSSTVNLLYQSDNRNRFLDWTANVNLQQQLCQGCDEQHKQTLSVDLDVAQFRLSNTNVSSFTVASSPDRQIEQLSIRQPNETQIVTLKTDYQQATEHGSWEAGLKGSWIDMFIRPRADEATTEFQSLLPSLTQAVDYTERTMAGYLNRSVTVGKYSIQAGLRVEYTLQQTRAQEQLINEQRYTQFFPNAQLSWTSAKQTQWTLSYVRRILRPTIDILSPNFTFSDPITLYRGNPALSPEFTQVVSFGAIKDDEQSWQVAYTHGSGIISEVLIRNDPRSAQLLNSYLNVSRSHRMDVIVGWPVTINDKWKFHATTTGFYNAITTGVAGVPRQGLFGGELQLVNTWTLGKWTANLRFWGQTAIIDGFLHYRPLFTVGGGIQRPILKEQGTFKLAFSDLFYSYIVRNYGQYLNTDVSFVSRIDTRRVLATLTYRFGNRKLKLIQERESGGVDEQGRVRR